jgi:hypothetical protein
MENYQKMYFTLFHAATDVIERLQSVPSLEAMQAVEILKKAQADAEEIYLTKEE